MRASPEVVTRVVPRQEPALDVQVSQCEQFVARVQKRLVAQRKGFVWFQSCRKEKVDSQDCERAAVVRDVPVPQPAQPDPGAQVARLEEVKVLQDERDALLATRPVRCGAFPLPDSLWETVRRSKT